MSDDHAEPCMIAYGNLSDGWRFVGPFDDFDAAVEYGDKQPTDVEWWVATLNTPQEGT